MNNRIKKNKNKSVLWGVSIEPELLEDKKIINDLYRYDLIIARESITYKALIEAGICKNVRLYPDPAFVLQEASATLPEKLKEGKYIGINISPLIQDLENVKNITIENYRNLISYIIKSTDDMIALIPHVIKKGNNDLMILNQLYNEYKNTGRIVIIGDCNCMELKFYISRCRIFVGARTHATIAAYSTCVPTLTLGYSVKAKGIANDIFGTYENYVLPVQSLKNECDLTMAFKWICKNEYLIRTHLKEFMPGYLEKTWQAGDEVTKLLGEL